MMRVQKTAKKKRPILLILFFAICACLFMTRSVNKPHKAADEKSPESIEVAMAKSSLPVMTVITVDHINTEMVSRDELPEGRFLSPTQIIGRVLAVPVVEGQVLTESCFVRRTMDFLPPQIPHGMRAVTVSVSSKMMPDRALLYPGCVVDVLVSYKLSGNTEGKSLSQTMLREIRVLAISGDSVVSKPVEEGETKKPTSRRTLVTLLVTQKQAEALSLAVENGRISLALRNPLDRKMFDIRKLQPLHDFRIGPCGEVISQKPGQSSQWPNRW